MNKRELASRGDSIRTRTSGSTETLLPISLNQLSSRTLSETRFGRSIFMQEIDGRIVETAVEARGARLGRPVLVVLVVSTLTVIGMFSILYYGSFG